MKRFHGFTAVELMVVIAIVAILATLAMPSFASLFKRYQLDQDVRALESAIYLARSEAMKRGGGVTLTKLACPSTTNIEWDCGWTVATTSGTPVVLKQVVTKGKNNINASGVTTRATFDRWGGIDAANPMSFSFQPKNDLSVEFTRKMCVSAGGRVRVTSGASECKS